MSENNNNFKLDFISISPQRTATNWVYQCLFEHPEVALTSPKEIHFFDNNYHKGIDWYKEHFSPKKTAKVFGEFSAGLLDQPQVAERLKKDFPNVKLICILREPISRAFSDYLHGAKPTEKNLIAVVDNFDKIVEQEKEANINISRGVYSKHLAKYFQEFPRQNILILYFEDIKKDPLVFLKKIFQFVGIDDTFIPTSCYQKKNVSRTYQFPKLKKIIDQLPALLGERGVNVLKKLGVKKLIKKNKLQQESLTGEISEVSRQKLKKIYETEIKNYHSRSY